MGNPPEITLVTNVYDNQAGSSCNSAILAATETPSQHDSATYTSGYALRGNVRSVTTPGDQACFQYDVTGTLRNTSSNAGSASYALQAGRNNSVPGQITTSGFTSTAQWDVLLRPGSQAGPNGDTVQTGYDTADRPASVTSPTGEVTNYQYFYAASPPYRQATTRAAWVKTYLDGFGRPVQTDTGNGTNTVVSRVLTEYDACACSPLGKVKKVSRPHLPGQIPVYTEYEYDAMGRTVNVKQPPNSGTTGSSGDTKYIYAGNSVTVTDAKGDYKRYYYDAFGNLVWAVDPKPGGGEYGTGYTYDLLNRLREVSMYRDGVTQIRTFGYNAQQRLETVTTPESGTTTYTYNPDGTLLRGHPAGTRVRMRVHRAMLCAAGRTQQCHSPQQFGG